MALRGCTGQGCSQAPQPMHASSATSGMRRPASPPGYGTIAMALVGQCSAQAPHAFFRVSTTQSAFTNRARPTCTRCFSASGSGRMAPVGQTSPQRSQSKTQEAAW